MKNILVFPCGSEIGLEVHRSLCFSTHFKLFGGSSISDHGKFVYTDYIENLPFVNEDNFIETINTLVAEHNIDYIIPAHDDVVLALAEAEATNKLNCKVITSDIKTCTVARSKSKTYETLKNVVNTPKLYGLNDISEGDYPLFLKPDIGQGSKGTQLVKNEYELTYWLKKNPQLLVLEYLPGVEYTVDCFTNRKGKLLYSEARIRGRIQNGISVNSGFVEGQRFKEFAESINSKLLFRGAWFFQVKENKHGELSLLEIAPRIAGTMGLSRARGVNLPLLSLFDAEGLDLSIFRNEYDVVIDRALENAYTHSIKYSHVYLDFDDLVIYDNKVNPSVIAFIYQCINRNISLHLITKHKNKLGATLKQHRLEGIFDEIIWIRSSQEKYMYIKEKDAIFIDDSFSERQRVHELCKIPVFDYHMLEMLKEKF